MSQTPFFNLDWGLLITGIAVFFARVIDVTMGTLRTISIVNGRTKTAFALGFVEISVWIYVISHVLDKIMNRPVLGLFYALGFSTGNAVGIMVERRIAFGSIALRAIVPGCGKNVADKLRNTGYMVTTFAGEGLAGPVTELYIVCRKKDSADIVGKIKETAPKAFFITEQAYVMKRELQPFMQQPTGWRAILKKK